MAEEELEDYAVQYEGEEESSNWIRKGGRAKVTYPNGDVYEGDFSEEKKKHGNGKYTYKLKQSDEDEDEDATNQHTYEGEWKDGVKSGNGIMIYPDGSKYTGEWANGRRHGQGVYRYCNGDIFSGTWADGGKNGNGVYVYANDVQLVGSWSSDTFSSGKWIFKDGTVYEGEFDNSAPTGDGLFAFASGNAQMGDFIRVGEKQILRWRPGGARWKRSHS